MAEGKKDAERYSQCIADPVRRRRLIESIRHFLIFHDFDGFDFVWEYPTLNDYVSFFCYLKCLCWRAIPTKSHFFFFATGNVH